MGRQYCENPEAGGLEPFDSSHHLDLRVGRTFGFQGGPVSRGEAVVSLDNATDAVVLDQCGLPQPGRTFRIQLRIW
jgi:iron complex outermembrane receptor protein